MAAWYRVLVEVGYSLHAKRSLIYDGLRDKFQRMDLVALPRLRGLCSMRGRTLHCDRSHLTGDGYARASCANRPGVKFFVAEPLVIMLLPVRSNGAPTFSWRALHGDAVGRCIGNACCLQGAEEVTSKVSIMDHDVLAAYCHKRWQPGDARRFESFILVL